MQALGAEGLHKKPEMVSFNLSEKNQMVNVVSKRSFSHTSLLSSGLLSHILFSQLSANKPQPGYSTSGLKHTTCTLRRQTTSPPRRLRFTPSKQTDMCFIRRKRHQSALFSYWSCKQQYVAIANCTALFISKKTQPKPKQLGILGSFRLSHFPSANLPCISIQYKARAFCLQPSIKNV